MVTRLSEPRLF